MTRLTSRAGLLAAALLPLALSGAPSAASAAPLALRSPSEPFPIRAPFHREIGELILEGIPALDAQMGLWAARYANEREATFLDWLPDGSMLVSTRFADAAEVHRVAEPLGAREQLTYTPEPLAAAAARPTPAASGFAFLEDTGGNESAQVLYYPLVQQPGNPQLEAATGAVGAELGRGLDGVSLDGTPGDVRLISDGKSMHGGLVWSKDGRELAFYGNERDESVYDIYVADVSAGTRPRLLVAGQKGLWRPLDWSRDGRELLVEQTLSEAESHLYLADTTTGALTPLDAGERKPGSIRQARFAPDGRDIYLISDVGGEFGVLRRLDPATHATEDLSVAVPWDIEDFDASADGRYIAYVVDEDGRSRLTVLDTAYKLRQSPSGFPDGVIRGLAFDRTGRRLAFSAESAASPRDVYVYDVERNAVVRWTHSEAGPPRASSQASAAFAPAQLIHFPTWDRASGGRRMLSAFLYRPRTPGPHPVLIEIHDGPQEESRPVFDPLVQLAVNELGYVVIAPNVRGSSGHGKAFLALDDGPLREDAVRDVGSLLVWIDLQPDLDRERVAVLGTGYGGYLALASLAEYNDRLRGGIDVCGISDFVRFLDHTAAWRRGLQRAEYGDERDPEIHDFLSRISPIAKAKWIRRPLLVVQGLEDPRVPASESTDLVATLRARGNDVWYLAARDEGHGFRKKPSLEMYYEVAGMFLQRLAAQE